MDELVRRLHRLEQRLTPLETVELATPVIARYTTTAGQSIPNNTSTIVDYATLVYDTNTLVTTGSAWKFTAKQAGYYHVDAAALFASTTTWAVGEVSQLSLFRNGTLFSRLDYTDYYDATAQFLHLNGTDVVQLVVGDFIDIRVVQVSGAALALHTGAGYNVVAIHKV